MKVSIIVPVYNVEKYLDRCLNSLVNQTLRDIEIFVVNDGSPDHSQEIIDKYANMDARVIPLKKKMEDYQMPEILLYPMSLVNISLL